MIRNLLLVGTPRKWPGQMHNNKNMRGFIEHVWLPFSMKVKYLEFGQAYYIISQELRRVKGWGSINIKKS